MPVSVMFSYEGIMERNDAWAVVRETDNRCINTTVWDGVAPWQPPAGTYLVHDYPCAIGWYRDPEHEIWLIPPGPLLDPETGEPLPGPIYENIPDSLGRMITWLWSGNTWLIEAIEPEKE